MKTTKNMRAKEQVKTIPILRAIYGMKTT